MGALEIEKSAWEHLSKKKRRELERERSQSRCENKE